MEKTNRLIVIGWTGIKRCYLNVDRNEAVRRFCAVADVIEKEFNYPVVEITFSDEFGAYDVYAV